MTRRTPGRRSTRLRRRGPETIALASVISTGAVGVAAIVFGWLGGWRGRVHDRAVRREDRQQERLQDVYEALIGYVEKRIRITAQIRPLMTVKGESPPPAVTDQEVERAQTLVDLHASPEVNRLIDEFGKTLLRIRNVDLDLRANERTAERRDEDWDPAPDGFADSAEATRYVAEYGINELRQIKDRLRQQMRTELNPGTKVPELDPSKAVDTQTAALPAGADGGT